MEQLMAAKLAEANGSYDESLIAIAQSYRDMYADYGACRQKEVHYHLQELEKLLVPTQTTKSTCVLLYVL
jgi:hypothetical protein